MAKHQKVREAEGLLYAPSWVHGKDLKGVAPDATRVHDLIDLAMQYVVKKAGNDEDPDKIRERVLIDVSQCGGRLPWTSTGCLRSLTTSSEIFTGARNRMVVLPELWSAMGFTCPKPCLAKLSAASQHSLLGEAMSVPSIALVLTSLVVNLDGHWEHL